MANLPRSHAEICIFAGSQAEALINLLKLRRDGGSPGARKLLKVVGRWFQEKKGGFSTDIALGQAGEAVSLVTYRGIRGSFHYINDIAQNKVSLMTVDFVELTQDQRRLYSRLSPERARSGPEGQSGKGGPGMMSSSATTNPYPLVYADGAAAGAAVGAHAWPSPLFAVPVAIVQEPAMATLNLRTAASAAALNRPPAVPGQINLPQAREPDLAWGEQRGAMAADPTMAHRSAVTRHNGCAHLAGGTLFLDADPVIGAGSAWLTVADLQGTAACSVGKAKHGQEAKPLVWAG